MTQRSKNIYHNVVHIGAPFFFSFYFSDFFTCIYKRHTVTFFKTICYISVGHLSPIHTLSFTNPYALLSCSCHCYQFNATIPIKVHCKTKLNTNSHNYTCTYTLKDVKMVPFSIFIYFISFFLLFFIKLFFYICFF